MTASFIPIPGTDRLLQSFKNHVDGDNTAQEVHSEAVTLVDSLGIEINGRTERDGGNELSTPLDAGATGTGVFKRVEHYGSIEILYAATTPIESVTVEWSDDGVSVLPGLLGVTQCAIKQISGYNVVYQVFSGRYNGKYYRLKVVNGPTAQTVFPGFITAVWINKYQYNGVFDFVDAEPSNLTKALVVKQFHQKSVNITNKILGASETFSTKGSPLSFSVDIGTDVFTSTSHGLLNGETIRFTDADSTPAPLSVSAAYYVVNATTNTFQLATYKDGDPLDITAVPVSGSPTLFFILSAGGITANAYGYFPGTNWADIDIHVNGTPFNAQGTLKMYFSFDGVTDHIGPVDIIVNDLTVNLPMPLRNYPYWRMEYVNNAVAQTSFEIHMVQRASTASDLTRFLTQVIGPAEPIKVIRALVEPSLKGQRGLLGADRAIFGSAIMASRVNQLEADYSRSIASNRVTASTSGGGAVAQANGQATLSTGTATTASAKLETNRSIKYSPENGIYATFTARFTTPTDASSHQRAGLYNDNNGFFLGYQGLTFGFTVRKAGSDTFTPLTNANGDPVDATFKSRFARGDRLEALDVTKLNIFRIRFGWLGSSVCHFEVQSPDGEWMVIHTLRQPNSSTVPHIESPNLPIRMEVIKSSSDTTDLVIGTGSWAAGSEHNPFGKDEAELHGREKVSVALENQTADATVYTVNTGRILKVRSMVLSVVNSSVATIGRFAIRDGSGGTIKMPTVIPTAVTGAGAGYAAINLTFPVPVDFSTSVYADVLSGTLTFSVAVVGYEEAGL